MANAESLRMEMAKKHNVPVGRILISLTELCDLLGIDGNTGRKWSGAGMPNLEEGSKVRPKRQWVFDSKAVIEWLVERGRQAGYEAASRKLGGAAAARAGAGGPSIPGLKDGEDEVDFRTRVANMHQAEIKAATAARQVVRVTQVVDLFRFHMRTASLTLSNVKGKTQAYLHKLGVPLVESERVVGDIVDEAIKAFEAADPLKNPLEADEDLAGDDEVAADLGGMPDVRAAAAEIEPDEVAAEIADDEA